MQVLDLRENKLLGDIPASKGNLSQLLDLRMAENMLEGLLLGEASSSNFQHT